MTSLSDRIGQLAIPFSMQRPPQPSSVEKEWQPLWMCWEVKLFFLHLQVHYNDHKGQSEQIKGYRTGEKQRSHALSRSSFSD